MSDDARERLIEASAYASAAEILDLWVSEHRDDLMEVLDAQVDDWNDTAIWQRARAESAERALEEAVQLLREPATGVWKWDGPGDALWVERVRAWLSRYERSEKV